MVGVVVDGLPPDEELVPPPDEVEVGPTPDPDELLAPLITLVAGRPPPPPPPHAVKTHMLAAAAKAAVTFSYMN